MVGSVSVSFRLLCITVPDAVAVDPLLSLKPPIVSTDTSPIVTSSSVLNLIRSYYASQSRNMSGASIDGGAESDQFMSLPPTPTADDDDDDDDTFFWKGESVHNHLVFLWLISEAIPGLRSFPRAGAWFRGVCRAIYTPRSSEW